MLIDCFICKLYINKYLQIRMNLRKLKCVLWIILIVYILSCCVTNASNRFNFSFNDEVQSLSELPLEQLIQIRSAVAKKRSEGKEGSINYIPTSLQLLERIGSNKGIRRHEEWEEKESDSKISKIFQLTITALSFLAFGAYLLTLIITAMRRNQNATTQSSVIFLSNLNLQKEKRPRREAFFDVNENDDYEVERLYRELIMLSNEFKNYYI